MARACWVSLRGSTRTPPPSSFADTSPCRTTCSAPFGPFTLTVWPSILAVTPEGTATSFLPTRDMVSFPSFRALEHRAEDFAAHVGVARVMVGHHALGRRYDRHAETVVDARQVSHRHVDATPGLRDPCDLADHRRAIEIFQLDLQLAAATRMLDRGIAADVAFVLEHIEHTDA